MSFLTAMSMDPVVTIITRMNTATMKKADAAEIATVETISTERLKGRIAPSWFEVGR